MASPTQGDGFQFGGPASDFSKDGGGRAAFEFLCKAMAHFSAARFLSVLDEALGRGAHRDIGRDLLTRALALSKNCEHFRDLADGLAARFPGLLSAPSPRGRRPLAEAAGMGRFDRVETLLALLDGGSRAGAVGGRPADLKEQLQEARRAVGEEIKAPATLWTGNEGALAETARRLDGTWIPAQRSREELEALLEATRPQARRPGPRSL